METITWFQVEALMPPAQMVDGGTTGLLGFSGIAVLGTPFDRRAAFCRSGAAHLREATRGLREATRGTAAASGRRASLPQSPLPYYPKGARRLS
jgi:hypothetical protein